MNFFTADLCDAHPDKVFPLTPIFTNYGGLEKCSGQIKTVKLPGNNKTLIEVLKSEGNGRVVVVDVEEDYHAVVGENLMKFAKENNWKAIIVNGFVRDTHITKQIDIALLALGTCPRKVIEPAEGETDIELMFAGTQFHNGDYCYIDLDGVVMSKENLLT